MSTKNVNTTTNAYNKGGYSTYNAFQPQLASTLTQLVQNPFGQFFQNQVSQQNAASRQVSNRNNTNLLRNMRTGGGILSNSAGFLGGSLNRNQLMNNFMQTQGFNNAINTALQNRNWAAASMEAYQPLQTGQTSTQTQSGLGTWLPQVIGAAANMLMPGVGSMLGGGSFSAGYRPTGAASAATGPASGMMQNPFGSGGQIPTYPQAQNPYFR